MDKLRQNAFWAGTAAALGVLLILFLVLVFPKFGEQSNAEAAIAKKKKELDKDERKNAKAEQDIQAHTQSKEQMIASYKKITDFYAASDRHLERWFEGVDGRDRGVFMSRYREEIQKLEGSLTERKTEIGIPDEDTSATRKFGFNWEEPLPQDWAVIIQQGGAAEEARVLKELQKRFWARQRVANAILRGDVKVTRVHDFRFFRKLANLQNVSWDQLPTGKDAVLWPGVKADQAGSMPRNFQEYELPNELGRTLTFGFALLLPYPEVPKILKEILNPDIEPKNETGSDRLLVNLLGAQISLREQNRPLIGYWYWDKDEADRAAKRSKAFQDAGMTDVLPRDILLSVTCQIVDFDATKVKKLEMDPPPPPQTEPKP
jgi:hypothetical protein